MLHQQLLIKHHFQDIDPWGPLTATRLTMQIKLGSARPTCRGVTPRPCCWTSTHNNKTVSVNEVLFHKLGLCITICRASGKITVNSVVFCWQYRVSNVNKCSLKASWKCWSTSEAHINHNFTILDHATSSTLLQNTPSKFLSHLHKNKAELLHTVVPTPFFHHCCLLVYVTREKPLAIIIRSDRLMLFWFCFCSYFCSI